ncbi:MAG: bis(5'-nucleosyl)-tetraphosphatase (symmetrical) YqeK [Subdoligranulum sp.]|nr:bis(5'-nucleosyl)-tetraphosphatase (symmetrical) YqeK [Subdoligranulum sp.]
MTYQQAEDMVRRTLSPKRFQHTMNVKKLAVRMAQHYGVDTEKAALAAILHDSAKELPRTELLQIMQDNAIIKKGTQNRPEPVWHGICAAILAKTQWNVQDEEILSAIACHTTGKENMSKLDKILFLADMTSAERDYPGVEELRSLEMRNLDKAMIQALKMTISFVEQKNAIADPESAKALAWLQAHSVEDDQ